MNGGYESTGSLREKSDSINKSMRTSMTAHHLPAILFPKVKPLTPDEIVEKETAAAWEEVQKRREERDHGTVEK